VEVLAVTAVELGESQFLVRHDLPVSGDSFHHWTLCPVRSEGNRIFPGHHPPDPGIDGLRATGGLPAVPTSPGVVGPATQYAPDQGCEPRRSDPFKPARRLRTFTIMYAATTSVALVGGEARPVEVQAHVGRQTEAFKLSGLPDTAVREAKDRVRAAVTSSGIRFPNRTVTVNLAPADLPKGGTDYDLPIALGILAASREIPDLRRAVVVGELALDGAVRAGSNALGAGVLSARHQVVRDLWRCRHRACAGSLNHSPVVG